MPRETTTRAHGGTSISAVILFFYSLLQHTQSLIADRACAAPYGGLWLCTAEDILRYSLV